MRASYTHVRSEAGVEAGALWLCIDIYTGVCTEEVCHRALTSAVAVAGGVLLVIVY